MILKRITACRECPFRAKSAGGWLGAWEGPEDILAQANSERGLPCHLTQGNITETNFDKKHACVGSLQSANASCRRYKTAPMVALQEKAGKADGIMPEWDFIKHHNEGPLATRSNA